MRTLTDFTRDPLCMNINISCSLRVYGLGSYNVPFICMLVGIL